MSSSNRSRRKVTFKLDDIEKDNKKNSDPTTIKDDPGFYNRRSSDMSGLGGLPPYQRSMSQPKNLSREEELRRSQMYDPLAGYIARGNQRGFAYSDLLGDIRPVSMNKYKPSNLDYFSENRYPSEVSEVNLVYRKYIGDLETKYSMKFHDQVLRNRRNMNELKTKAATYEAMNDGLHAKMRVLDEKTVGLETKGHFLEAENVRLKDLLEKTSMERNELVMLARDHGITINKFQGHVNDLEFRDKRLKSEFDMTTLDYFKKIRDLREQLSLLTAKAERDCANYELLLKDKNDIIADLQNQLTIKDRKLSLINTMERELEMLRDKYQNDMKENSNLIRKLQFQLEEAMRYRPKIFNGFEDLQKKRVEKIGNKPIKEVVFENNPYLVEQVDKFRDEMHRAQEAEAAAKRDAKVKEEEVTRLRNLVDSLRKGIMDYKIGFGEEHRPDYRMITKYVMEARADIINRILTLNQKISNRAIRELAFRVLYLHKQLRKLSKLYIGLRRERYTALKNAKRDNPLFVWSFVRERLVEWLFEIYCRSHDSMDKKKGNSFLIFKINMEDIVATEQGFLDLIIPTYVYLHDIVESEIPKYQLRPVNNIEAFKRAKINNIGKVIAYNSEFIDKSSEWIEDTISQTIYRQKHEKKSDNWEILFLYRFLTILYRIRYPVKRQKLKVEYALRIFLEMWICKAAINFFHAKSKGIQHLEFEQDKQGIPAYKVIKELREPATEPVIEVERAKPSPVKAREPKSLKNTLRKKFMNAFKK